MDFDTIPGRVVGGFVGWAMVELMGHRQRVGAVTEVEMAGTKMLRIDIPIPPPESFVTEFYGGSAIYSIRPVTEDVARNAARASDPRPWKPADYRPEDSRQKTLGWDSGDERDEGLPA